MSTAAIFAQPAPLDFPLSPEQVEGLDLRDVVEVCAAEYQDVKCCIHTDELEVIQGQQAPTSPSWVKICIEPGCTQGELYSIPLGPRQQKAIVHLTGQESSPWGYVHYTTFLLHPTQITMIEKA